jgi:chromosomal replication initiator protein
MTDLEYFIEETLEGIPIPVTNERILNAVCLHFKVSEEAIKGKSRLKNTVLARHFYMFLLKDKGVFKKLREIGETTNRDHATALYAIDKLKHWLENYEDIKEIYNNINQKLINK